MEKSVKPKTTPIKILIMALTLIYSAFVIAMVALDVPVAVAEMTVKILFFVLSASLGLNIWQLVNDTSKLDDGQYKEIYFPDYIVALVSFGVIFIVAYNVDKTNYVNVLAWSGAGAGIVIGALISAIKANQIST